MPQSNKSKLGRAFSRGAVHYDAHAPVQRHAARQLLARLPPAIEEARAILDVGAGTGALLEHMTARFPQAALHGVDLAFGMAHTAHLRTRGRAHVVVADAEALPWHEGAFDLVISTSTFQWLPRLEPALAEARRVLAPGGTVAIALFGGRTLWELHRSWNEALPAGASDRSHRFHDVTALTAAATAVGLTGSIDSECVIEYHPDPFTLLRTLKRIGAGLPHAATPGLRARGALQHMAHLYQARHGGSKGIPATWEIFYAVLHPASGPTRRTVPCLEAL